jgi:ligand-binding SRPBCC domain-containing protein
LALLERVQFLPRPAPEVFAFFSEIENLPRITPPSLRFEILTAPPPRVAEGLVVDYRLCLLGLPVRWSSRIEGWEPERRFVDFQTRGPYAWWRHVHEFHAVPRGTLVVDRVGYEIPLGVAGALVAGAFVRRTLVRTFAFRRASLAAILGPRGA